MSRSHFATLYTALFVAGSGAVGLAGPGPQSTKAPETALERVDELFVPVAGKGLPGASVAVVKDGEVLLTKGYGMADVGKGIANSPSTRFRIGSVTKSFTAIAVLQLVEKGRLKLDAPLSQYLPDIPNGNRIHIAHLLSHTAGVPDFIPIEEVERRPLEFEPGTRINYSNNGYLLLGRVVEKVSGQPWDEYLRDHIFAPLGMKNSGYDVSADLPGRATGYLAGKNGGYTAVAADDASGAHAAGGLYSTVEDMVRWGQGLASGKLLRKDTLDRASTPFVLSDGRKIAYGFGWMTRNYRGLREVGHGGDITGFNAYFARYPDEKFTVIVLSNTGMRPPGPLPDGGSLAHKIAELWLGDKMGEPAARPTVRVDSASLDGYAGRYKVDAPEAITNNMGREIVISRQGDRLVAEANGMQIPLEAISKTQFQAPGSPAELTFVCDGAGVCPKVVITLMGLREFYAHRVQEDPAN